MAKKTLKNLILITGDEVYLREQKKKELLSALGASGSFNFNTFTEDNLDLDEIKRLADTAPFMEDKRKILITDSGWFKRTLQQDTLRQNAESADSGLETAAEPEKLPSGRSVLSEAAGWEISSVRHEAKKRTQAQDALTGAFSDIPESTVIIFDESEVSAQSSLYKLIKKKGEIYKFDSVNTLKGRDKTAGKTDILGWARGVLKAEKRNISDNVLSTLLELCGYDMMTLSGELEKLISYTLDKPDGYRISADDVSAICSQTITDRVFVMTGLKLSGDIRGAVTILEELFAIRVPALKILSILERQYERAMQVKDCMEKGMTDTEIMSGLELKDWQLRQVKKQAGRSSAKALASRLEECISMDRKVKQGDMTDRLALELLMVT